jgi:hypothetical protein
MIDTGDCRAQEVQFKAGKLVTAFTEGHDWGSGAVSALRTLVIDAASSAVNVDNQFGADKSWYFYPAIVRDPLGNMAMVFNRSGTNEYAGVYYSAWLAGETNWESESVLRAGEAYYNPGSSLWGHYSGGALDGADPSRAWIYSEYAVSTTAWGTWIGELQLPLLINDQCNSALALTNGILYSMNTSGATSTNDPATACGTAIGKGVWFSFTPDASGTALISTCGSDFNTVLQVYSGACASLNPVTCNDGNGPACSGTQASAQFQVSGGTKYLIFLAGSGGASGNLAVSATLCQPPAITLSALCPATNGTPGGVLGFSGQVCNTGGVRLTNVTIFDNQALTTGTNLVASYALLTNGECRNFSGSIMVPTNVCLVTNILTANGTSACLATGAPSVTVKATNVCPVLTTPCLFVSEMCPNTNGIVGGVIGFTVFVANCGNVSLTNVMITNCVLSGIENTPPSRCSFLARIPRLEPNQSVQVTGTEAPIENGASAVVNIVTGTAADACGKLVSTSVTNSCPVCQPPTVTNLFTTTTLTPDGILLSSSVDVSGTPLFTLEWVLGSVTNNTGSGQTLNLLIPLDQVAAYVTNGDFSTLSVRAFNACGSGDQSGGFSSCIVCLSRGVPVSSSTNASAYGTGPNVSAGCGDSGYAAKWYPMFAADSGVADISVQLSTGTNCFVSVFAVSNYNLFPVACTNTVSNLQTRLQFQAAPGPPCPGSPQCPEYYLVVTNGGRITNLTYGFVPRIYGAKSNDQFQLRSGIGPALPYAFQASTTLGAQTVWSNLFSTNFPTNGAVYLDTKATNFSQRFYRVVPVP